MQLKSRTVYSYQKEIQRRIGTHGIPRGIDTVTRKKGRDTQIKRNTPQLQFRLIMTRHGNLTKSCESMPNVKRERCG